MNIVSLGLYGGVLIRLFNSFDMFSSVCNFAELLADDYYFGTV